MKPLNEQEKKFALDTSISMVRPSVEAKNLAINTGQLHYNLIRFIIAPDSYVGEKTSQQAFEDGIKTLELFSGLLPEQKDVVNGFRDLFQLIKAPDKFREAISNHPNEEDFAAAIIAGDYRCVSKDKGGVGFKPLLASA